MGGHIDDAAKSLRGTPETIEHWLGELRTSIVNHYASEYITRARVPAGYHIHVINAFMIAAKEHGWDVNFDMSTIHDHFLQTHRINEAEFQAFNHYLDREYNPVVVYDCVQNRTQDKLLNVLKEYAFKKRMESY